MKILNKTIEIIKSNATFITFSILALILIVVYIANTADNAIYMDRMRLYAESLDDILKGNFSIGDAFNIHSGHLGVGTYLVLYFEIFVLNFQGLFFCYMVPVLVFGIFFVNYLVIKKLTKNRIVRDILTAVVGILLFSLFQWEIILFSYGVIIYIGNLLFMICFYLLDKYRNDTSAKYYKTILVLVLSISNIILFGGGYSFGFLGASIVTSAVIVIINRIEKKSFKECIPSVIAGSVLLLTALILVVFVMQGGSGGSVSLVDMIKFYFLSLGSLFVSVEQYSSITLPLLAGVFLFLVYLFSVFMFFRTKMYEKTYFPLMLLAFSQIIHISILMSRASFAIDYGMSSRYYATYIFELVGTCLILCYSLKEKVINFRKVIFGFGCLLGLLIIISQVRVLSKEIKTSPYRKAVYEQMIYTSFTYESLEPDELAHLYQNDYEVAIKCFDLLKENNLYVYDSSSYLRENLKSPMNLYGFEKDDASTWISKDSSFVINSKGLVTMTFANPIAFQDNTIKIFSDDELIFTGSIKSGEEVMASLNVEGVSIIRIELSFDTIPSEIGSSADNRSLGLVVKEITNK